ncbi:hypothetical protein [Caenimonas sp. SL110]|uniref:hypothetical protein n=1 Tax=Caenimonas sp. SL110 TaxID=1450524 RepID=UPI001EE6A636|nr:hypothetical protein [Caenimonas sp. SL110]
MSEWAATQGFGFSIDGSGHEVALQGNINGKPWRMQIGRPTRNYILGEELRARAELAVRDEVAVLVMNKPLKEALEKKAYSMFTDPLQTQIDPSLPEEMRWLAMFEEVGWEGPSQEFWERYSVLTDRRENAMAWIEPQLAMMMTDWPEPAPSVEVPFMILILRGKAYLRMEYSPAGMPTLRHASLIFQTCCDSALVNLGPEPRG